MMLAIALAGAAAGLVHWGWRVAAGFLVGAGASWWNFRKLNALAESLGSADARGRWENEAWILIRLLALVLGAFVILRFTQISIYGAFAGLFVSAAAVILEGIFELAYER